MWDLILQLCNLGSSWPHAIEPQLSAHFHASKWIHHGHDGHLFYCSQMCNLGAEKEIDVLVETLIGMMLEYFVMK